MSHDLEKCRYGGSEVGGAYPLILADGSSDAKCFQKGQGSGELLERRRDQVHHPIAFQGSLDADTPPTSHFSLMIARPFEATSSQQEGSVLCSLASLLYISTRLEDYA